MRHISIIGLALLCIIPASGGSVKAIEPITIVTEEWPPFNYTENGEIKGFSFEIVRYIMKQQKVHYEITVLPGIRSRQALDAGKRTMMFTMLRTPDRESLYKWIGPLGEEAFYFYKKKGNPLIINSLNDAKQVSHVSCRNYGLVYSFLIQSGFTNLDTSANPESIYLKVIHDRCDLAIGETPLGVSYWLKKSGFAPDVLEQTSLSILKYRLYLACSKDIPDTEIAQWQHALDTMKKTGEYNRLYKKYLK